MRIITEPPTLVLVTVYGLYEPGTEHSDDPWLRYVGRTDQPLQVRLSQHIQAAKSGAMGNRRLRQWILKLLRYGKRPVILELESYPSHMAALMAETVKIERSARVYRDFLNEQHNEHNTRSEGCSEPYLRSVGAA